MAADTSIEWTDATWNPIVGCSIVSPGCTNCYAMKMAGRIEAMTAPLTKTGQGGAPHYNGTTRKVNGNTVWTGKVAMAPEHILLQPLAWRAPRRIFVNSMGDLFHEDVPDEWIDKVFAVMALSPQHTFQVLTKRARRMREYLTAARATGVGMEALGITLDAMARDRRSTIGTGVILTGDIAHLEAWPLPNVWLGVSAERQQEADERVPSLLFTPAAIRFVSAEPLLSEINFRRISLGTSDAEFYGHPLITQCEFTLDALAGAPKSGIPGLDWIIAGGESGQKARPMHPAWPREIRDQCQASDTAFFFKQWGEWTPGENVDSQHGVVKTAERFDDKWLFGTENLAWTDGHIDDQPDLYRVGKKAAGRLLDGVEHNAMPEVP